MVDIYKYYQIKNIIWRVSKTLSLPIKKSIKNFKVVNFVNLLDCAAITVPAGFDSDGHLPGSVTVIAPSFTDDALAHFADSLHRMANTGMGVDRAAALPEASRVARADDGFMEIVVVGAHLTGMPLNREIASSGGRLIRTSRTAGDYRLFVLPNTTPPKPGLIREPGFKGQGLEIEVWALPADAFGRFVQKIPAPLGIGKITLEDNTSVSGFLCEAHATKNADEITSLGGWRAFIGTQSASFAHLNEEKVQ